MSSSDPIKMVCNETAQQYMDIIIFYSVFPKTTKVISSGKGGLVIILNALLGSLEGQKESGPI